MNLDKGLEARLMELLLSLFYVPEEIKIMAKTGYEEDPETIRRKLPLYLKYTLRCITSCVRSPVGVLDFTKNQTAVMQIVEFLENVRDEEILANSAKVIRIVLRDDTQYEKIINKHVELGNTLMESLQKYSFSEHVLVELLLALRNFTRVPAKVPLVAKTHLGTLVSLTV
jgi:hypothetical protein